MVAIIVPVLKRPHRVAPLMENVAAVTQRPYRLLFVATDSDSAEIAALKAAGADFVTINAPGTYARKINLGARETTEPLVFSAADDVVFHPGWLEAATAQLVNGIEVVGTNDLGNPRTMSGAHSTHSLFTRRYIDQGGVIDGPPGTVLHEGYPHEYCDDEFIGTAKARGVYAHAFDSHVEHLHYLWGKGTDDATYQLGRSRTVVGKHLFRRRKRLWARL